MLRLRYPRLRYRLWQSQGTSLVSGICFRRSTWWKRCGAPEVGRGFQPRSPLPVSNMKGIVSDETRIVLAMTTAFVLNASAAFAQGGGGGGAGAGAGGGAGGASSGTSGGAAATTGGSGGSGGAMKSGRQATARE